MIVNAINIAERAGARIPYTVNMQEAAAAAFGYKNIKVLDAEKVDVYSVFGTPVFMDLTLGKISYTEDGAKNTCPELHIPCCIVNITGTKNVVKTEIQGSKYQNTFKEYIGMSDYVVNIQGILANDTDDKYPKDKVYALNKFIKSPVEIPVIHKLFGILGITDLVVEGFSFPPKQGFENLQAFELNCVSETQKEISLKNKQALYK